MRAMRAMSAMKAMKLAAVEWIEVRFEAIGLSDWVGSRVVSRMPLITPLCMIWPANAIA